MKLHKNLHKFSVFLILILLSGCAITTELPTSMIESPETSGQSFHSLKAEFANKKEITIAPDYTANPVLTGNQTINRADKYMIGGGVDFGLADRFDLGIRRYLAGPWMLSGKFQFLGKNRTTADAENISISGIAAIGTSSQSFSETYTYDSSATTKYGNDGSTWIGQFGIMAGYRFSKMALVYGGPFISSCSYKGTISQSSRNKTYDYKGSTNAQGATIGFTLGSSDFFALIDGTYSNTKTSTGSKVEQVDASVALQVNISKPASANTEVAH